MLCLLKTPSHPPPYFLRFYDNENHKDRKSFMQHVSMIIYVKWCSTNVPNHGFKSSASCTVCPFCKFVVQCFYVCEFYVHKCTCPCFNKKLPVLRRSVFTPILFSIHIVSFCTYCIVNNHVADEIEEVGPSPRLGTLRIRPDFQGFGFNLHAERHIPGQFVGKVEPGSPADEAGLRKGDHIIEVNGRNMQDSTHTEVVGQIKSNPGVVRLLVIDKDDEEFYKSRNITIHGGMSNVIVGESRHPEENHMDFGDEEEEVEEHIEVNNNANVKGEQVFKPKMSS